MNDNNNDELLSSIWQQQTSHTVDVQALIKQARSQRSKQRFYIFLDVLSLVPFLLFFILDFPNSVLLYVLLSVLFASSVVMVIYFTKLRWYAAVGDITNTNDYVSTLIKQYKNNAQIAKINKFSGYLVLPFGVLISITLSLAENRPLQDTISNIFVTFGMMLVFMIPWCWWAGRRQLRFEQKCQQLSDLYKPL